VVPDTEFGVCAKGGRASRAGTGAQSRCVLGCRCCGRLGFCRGAAAVVIPQSPVIRCGRVLPALDRPVAVGESPTALRRPSIAVGWPRPAGASQALADSDCLGALVTQTVCHDRHVGSEEAQTALTIPPDASLPGIQSDLHHLLPHTRCIPHEHSVQINDH